MTWLFWICLGIVVYAYLGYPLVLLVVSVFKKRRPLRAPFRGSFSFVLCVHNEEANLRRRVDELRAMVERSGLDGEIILVSDGSTDATVPLAHDLEAQGLLRFLERPGKAGKAAALSAGAALAKGDILVFCDARQRWDDAALPRLLENFADPHVGAVSGDLVLETASGVLAGVALYWRMEKWLRKRESAVYSQVGATGAVSACRRELFRPIPAGTLCDDVYWPLCVAMQGYRVVHEENARAYDRLPDKPRDEFRRKVRTLAGCYQIAGLLPASLLPWRNPVWFAWVSHKLLRLLVPWALIALFAVNLALVLLDPPAWARGETAAEFWRDAFFPVFLAVQGLGYLLGSIGLEPRLGRRAPLAGVAASFLVLNAAAFLAFWVWATGRTGRAWSKIAYEPADGP
ncbi:MAG: glycosyltransferase [Gemmataceae bacterium]